MVIEKALAIHSSESEKAVLGSILLDETCFELVKDFIPEKDVFYELKNQSVWEVICKLKKENIPVDLINVSTKLDNMTYYVSGLVDSTPTAANAISYDLPKAFSLISLNSLYSVFSRVKICTIFIPVIRS